MNVVLLAGGFGTRLSEETATRPKPMIEIGGKPLLWHIMQIYAHYGFREFIICCGYKGEVIKAYFDNFFLLNNDIIVDLSDGHREVISDRGVDWRVKIIDTGLNTETGGRLARIKPLLEGETFMVTYGDGVADIDIKKLLAFHRSHGKIATVTAVRPVSRFGALDLDGNGVKNFSEKPQASEGWINGGFFVFEPGLFDLLEGDDTILERNPLRELAEAGQLMAFRHTGFWQPVDTLREKRILESLWESGKAPWLADRLGTGGRVD